MTEKKIKWTQQQKQAITARGSDVLVSASAGTGKTAVLSGRCVDIVADKTDVKNILVLTFTEMAAEQMRARIGEQLKDAFLESGDKHLRLQLMLLQSADISTIHSFCKRLITEFFYKLGLDPTFGIIDGDEARLLKTEALEKTIEWAWQQSNLVQGLEQLFRRRDLQTNEGFLAKIISLSNFLEGVVSRENWYERAIQLGGMVSPFASGLGEEQKQIVADRLRSILNQLQQAEKLYEGNSSDGDWAEKLKASHIKPVAQCIEFLKAGDWDKCAEEIRNFTKPTTYKPKDVPETVAEVIRKRVKRALDAFEGLSALAILNPDYLDRVGGAVSLQTRVLVELVKKFGQLYSQAKKAINCLDFADLERYALRLLVDESSQDEQLSPSATALALRQRYKYIFVDEYQDINSVQQVILDMLSSGGNIFVVGDVKQSIYAWRGAEPEIFIERLNPASSVSGGLRVDLNANFRSAGGILDFVNKVFEKIMTASFAKIDYDESAKLKPAAENRDEEKVVEFHILDEKGKDEDENETEIAEESSDVFNSRQRQAAAIAQRIKQMVGAETGKPEFQIFDKQRGEKRGVEYRDIVVLMRSLVKKANDYVEIFRLAGIPVSCQATAGYFKATEITDILCLLKVLDNPQRDIEIAAVLRSPFFKVSDTELAKIKIHNKANEQYKNFYDCALEYSTNGKDANFAEKLKKVLEQIEQWRGVARDGSLADLIWHIYRQTGFLSFVSALPSGEARRANLLKLHERAIQFEGFASSAGRPSLGRFIEFVEELQEIGQDWSPAEPDSSAENAVRIISVHKSKGLEFPVVFLAELDGQFNKRDIQEDFLADANDTLGLQIIDRKSNTKLSSLAHQVIAEKKLAASLAEEMRILYVAMTRARQRLILSASEKKKFCQDIISDGFFFGDEPISDWQLRRCRSPLEWVLYGLADQKSLHDALDTELAAGGDNDLFSIKLYGQGELEGLGSYIRKLKDRKGYQPKIPARNSKRGESKLLSQVKKSLSWRYSFGDTHLLPAKQSVTQLTHREDEYVRFDYSRVLERKPKAVSLAESAETIDFRLIGSAAHLIISQLNLSKPVTKETIEKTKQKLLSDGAITEAVAGHINTDSILAFFESDLGKSALDSTNTVYREWPFTFALPASELLSPRTCGWGHCEAAGRSNLSNDEIVVVQGIIDMLIQTPEGLLVIDFKTDDVTAKIVPQRAELYREQLTLYGRAAETILKTKTIAKWLYFLKPNCAVEV
ncbi:MAG: helicase-exonuclease AddAB subunit AddA [Sedimentisphaerales bacterium]|nr:helicase-exonuclease AddAB subunit AddA [Sedimentisphaerales bacterium]